MPICLSQRYDTHSHARGELPELLRQPPPAPDKIAIGKLLRAGVAVPGARLIGNQEPMVIFRGKLT